MSIFDDLDNILQDEQKNQKIEALKRVTEIQQKIIDMFFQQQVVFANLAFPGAELDTEGQSLLRRCQEQVPNIKMAVTKLAALNDQLNAARAELAALDE